MNNCVNVSANKKKDTADCHKKQVLSESRAKKETRARVLENPLTEINKTIIQRVASRLVWFREVLHEIVSQPETQIASLAA